MFTEAPKSVMQALQRCHHASEAPPSEAAGKVKVRDQKACCNPGGTMSFPAGVEEIPSHTTSVASPVVAPQLPYQVEAIDLSVLSAEEQEEAQGLLWKHASVFLSQDGDLGCTNLVPIKLLSWMRPPSVSATGVFHHQNTRWSKSTSTCSRSACVQVIHESSSLFASPIVLVEKKDGSLHLCVDYW